MNSRPEHYTPRPYDPYADDDNAAGGWFNSDGYVPRQQPGHDGQGVHGHQGHDVHQGYQGHDVPESYDYDPRVYPYQQLDDQPTFALSTVAEPEPESAEPGYHIPETPDAGWDDTPSRRRAWVSRGVLGILLIIQTLLSLRLSNTAFQDEALYLAAGHNILEHWSSGTPLHSGYESYFSGSPMLYPVAAAFVDGWFGLSGARALSLLCMLGATVLLYSFTRRLFNERVALVAAALFAVTQPTIVLGWFATYDAPAIFLLALSAWIIVRTNRAPVFAVLLAAPVMVLAVAVKYASALYVPTLIVLAALTAWHHRGWRCVPRALLLGVGTAALAGIGLMYTDVLAGVRQTTTNRAHGTDTASALLEKSAEWGGLMFATAVAGAVAYALRGRMNESPRSYGLNGPGWRWRALLGVTLAGTALLAPAYQIHLHTAVSLYKHLDFGLLFAAPMAGVGVIRLVGKHFRYPQLGIMIWVGALCLGVSQSEWRFGLWPDSSGLVQAIEPYMEPGGRYLGETYEVPVYYLRDKTKHSQWTSTYGIGYPDKKGVVHHGNEGYRLALEDGYFDLVVLDGVATPGLDAYIERQVTKSGHYRLIGKIPFRLSSGGTGAYRVWVKTA
ncbi:ArnT family glycosyltransferase [Streptomyces olivochromogenes]|uniref:ArnT family glycosyltransferase n=1 Tax=Streptomyces olivochromogenes TaxID=1963 RepID=UPI001F3878F5|nr:glycosyltransferase family 39 protein [Streptomyces olivochromogenes]MCF3133245.1 glycosyltransferase family 39 protein [Streptomyces olivochromogenes]